MSATLKVTEEVLATPVAPGHVQFLPCAIKTAGTTDVEERFNKATRNTWPAPFSILKISVLADLKPFQYETKLLDRHDNACPLVQRYGPQDV